MSYPRDKPTPEQIAGYEGPISLSMLRALEYHGYVIIHPDDVPKRAGTPDDQRTATGWNACRDYIFAREVHA